MGRNTIRLFPSTSLMCTQWKGVNSYLKIFQLQEKLYSEQDLFLLSGCSDLLLLWGLVLQSPWLKLIIMFGCQVLITWWQFKKKKSKISTVSKPFLAQRLTVSPQPLEGGQAWAWEPPAVVQMPSGPQPPDVVPLLCALPGRGRTLPSPRPWSVGASISQAATHTG